MKESDTPFNCGRSARTKAEAGWPKYRICQADLPGCISDGATPEDAIKNVEDALQSWIATAEEFGDPIPEPGTASRHSGKWVMRVSKSLHMRLAQRAKAEGVSLNAFAAQLLAEGIGRRS